MEQVLLTPTDFNRLLSELREYVTPKAEQPMTSKEAASFMRISVRTLERWVSAGKVPSHLNNGIRYYYASEINSWIKEK